MLFPTLAKTQKYNSYSDHRKQVNNVIKTLFHEVPEDKMDITQEIFCAEYTAFDRKIVSFDAD